MSFLTVALVVTIILGAQGAFAEGQESGGGIVFDIEGDIRVFAFEERSLEFVVSESQQTRDIYAQQIAPQLVLIEKIAPALAKFLKERFEGRKGPRFYFSKFRAVCKHILVRG